MRLKVVLIGLLLTLVWITSVSDVMVDAKDTVSSGPVSLSTQTSDSKGGQDETTFFNTEEPLVSCWEKNISAQIWILGMGRV